MVGPKKYWEVNGLVTIVVLEEAQITVTVLVGTVLNLIDIVTAEFKEASTLVGVATTARSATVTVRTVVAPLNPLPLAVHVIAAVPLATVLKRTA